MLFSKGDADLNDDGRRAVDAVGDAIRDLELRIPSDLPWIVRVDGHTDRDPIRTPRFPSNWELSSARALSVVRRLIDRGVSPSRLTAAGFGEFQPLDFGDGEEAFRRNRRIEIKLTGR